MPIMDLRTSCTDIFIFSLDFQMRAYASSATTILSMPINHLLLTHKSCA